MKRLGASLHLDARALQQEDEARREPSRMGTFLAADVDRAGCRAPRPAQADIRCSMVCTFGAPGSPPALMVEAMRVSRHRLRR
jgi:hypothetical protein